MEELVYISDVQEVKSLVYKIEAQDIKSGNLASISSNGLSLISSMVATCMHKVTKSEDCYRNCIIPIETNIKIKLQDSGDYHSQVTMTYRVEKTQYDIDNAPSNQISKTLACSGEINPNHNKS